MNIFNAANNLDIDGWLRGIIGGFISGGASAVTGAIVLPALDAQDFNVYTSRFYIAIGALFVANGLVSVTKFLSTQPLPVMKQVTTTVQTVQKAPSSTIISTTKETHQEPVDSAKD